MIRYPKEFKEQVLKRLLPPNAESVKRVAEETGVSHQTLRNWMQEAHIHDLVQSHPPEPPSSLSTSEKFRIVVETLSMSEDELSEYARKAGLYDCPSPPQCPPQTNEATTAALANTPDAAANSSENVPPRFNSHHHHQYRHRRSRDSDVRCKEIIIFSLHQIIQSNHGFQKIPVHTTGLISSLTIR